MKIWELDVVRYIGNNDVALSSVTYSTPVSDDIGH